MSKHVKTCSVRGRPGFDSPSRRACFLAPVTDATESLSFQTVLIIFREALRSQWNLRKGSTRYFVDLVCINIPTPVALCTGGLLGGWLFGMLVFWRAQGVIFYYSLACSGLIGELLSLQYSCSVMSSQCDRVASWSFNSLVAYERNRELTKKDDNSNVMSNNLTMITFTHTECYTAG